VNVKCFITTKDAHAVLPEDRYTTLSYKEPPSLLIERLLIICAKDCDISSPNIDLFGFSFLDSNKNPRAWVNLNDSIGDAANKIQRQSAQVGTLDLELRLRFDFPTGRKNSSGEFARCVDEIKISLLDTVCVRYLFLQRSYEFLTDKIALITDEEDKYGPSFQVAILDLVRIAKEKDTDVQTIRKDVKLKSLLPASLQNKVREMNTLRKQKFNKRINKLLKTLEQLQEQYENHTQADVYHLYIDTLSSNAKNPYYDSFDVTVVGERKNIDLSIRVECDRGIVKYLKNSLEEVWSTIHDITDLRFQNDSKESNSDKTTDLSNLVFISCKQGKTLCISMRSSHDVISFTSCLNGYYRLLVDYHDYLCLDVTPSSLVRRLNVGCHGPLRPKTAEKRLLSKDRLCHGDCLLRMSSANFDEYYLSTALLIDDQFCVKHYRLSESQGRLRVCIDDEYLHFEDFSSFLNQCSRGDLGCLPFSINRLMKPVPEMKSELTVCDLNKSNLTEDSEFVASPKCVLFDKSNFEWTQSLNETKGKFTVVQKYLRRSAESKSFLQPVVVKKLVEITDRQLKHHTDRSLDKSSRWLIPINNAFIIPILGTLEKCSVFPFLPLGSITAFIKRSNTSSGNEWSLTVIWQITQACMFLDSKNIAHGNICGKNILLFRDNPQPLIKLNDAGVVTELYGMGSKPVKPILSPPWLAVEHISSYLETCRLPQRNQYPTLSGDKWSFACTAIEILKLVVHNQVTSELRIENTPQAKRNYIKSLTDDDDFLLPQRPELVPILRKCFDQNPEKRPTYRQILDDIQIAELMKVSTNFLEAELPEEDEDAKTDSVITIDDDEIRRDKKLGAGNFGDVYKSWYIGSKDIGPSSVVAVKELKSGTEEIFSEIEVMRTLQHKFVVRMIGITTSECIVMEYITNGCIREWFKEQKMRGFNVNNNLNFYKQLLIFCHQIAEGMAYLHSKEVLHRDLALRNILLSKEGQELCVKISDFGLSRRVSSDSQYYFSSGVTGPVMWYAPEVIDPEHPVYKKSSDIWSYGVTAWEMFAWPMEPFGSYPNFYKPLNNWNALKEFVCKLRNDRDFRLPINTCDPSIPDDVYTILKNCWEYQPDRRRNFFELQNDFEGLVNSC